MLACSLFVTSSIPLQAAGFLFVLVKILAISAILAILNRVHGAAG